MLKTALDELMSSDDPDAAQRLLHALLEEESPGALLGQLLAVLQQDDDAQSAAAIDLIAGLEYPQNRAAVPALLRFVADVTPFTPPEELSLCYEAALRALVRMGPTMLFDVIAEAAEDRTVTDNNTLAGRVVDALEGAGEYVFRQHRDTMDAILHQILDVFSREGKAALPTVKFVLSTVLKEWWNSAIEVGEAIGYPDNASLIPLLLSHACDTNNPAVREVFHLLQTWGPEVLAPFLQHAFWRARPGGQDHSDSSRLSFAGLCRLFTEPPFDNDTTLLLMCFPMICFVFSQRAVVLNFYDASAFVAVLKALKGTDLKIAVPLLLTLAQQQEFSAVQADARSMLRRLDKPTQALYRESLTLLEHLWRR